MEHLHHFHLSDDPFRNEPELRVFFESGPHREAWQRLDRAVRQAKGLSVLVGESGSGKTMVVRRLLDCLEEEVFEASMIVVMRGAADPQSLLGRFASQLGVEEPAADRKGVLAQLYEQLAIVREDGRHAVLIIDDADTLVTEGALAEVCGLLKLEYEDRRLLSLVLAGSPLLEEALAEDPDLVHRVGVKFHLAALDASATAAYFAHRLRAVGGDSALLDADAVAALRAFGHGLPGRMNTLADNALFEAFLSGHPRITRVDVERAGGDLGWEPRDVPADAVAPTPADPEPEAAALPSELPLADLDSELDAAFAATRAESTPAQTAPAAGPPKEEDEEIEDLLVELIEE